MEYSGELTNQTLPLVCLVPIKGKFYIQAFFSSSVLFLVITNVCVGRELNI